MQPLVEGQIFGDAAEQGHGGVAVAVDQAGHYDCAVGVDDFCGSVFCFQVGAGAHRHDGITANSYRAVIEDVALSVHGDYGAAGYQQIYFFLREGGRRCGKKKDKSNGTADERR